MYPQYRICSGSLCCFEGTHPGVTNGAINSGPGVTHGAIPVNSGAAQEGKEEIPPISMAIIAAAASMSAPTSPNRDLSSPGARTVAPRAAASRSPDARRLPAGRNVIRGSSRSRSRSPARVRSPRRRPACRTGRSNSRSRSRSRSRSPAHRDGAAGSAGNACGDEGLLRALETHRVGLKASEARTRDLEAEAGGWGVPPTDLRHEAEVVEVRLTDQLLVLTMMLDECTTPAGREAVKGVMSAVKRLGERLGEVKRSVER